MLASIHFKVLILTLLGFSLAGNEFDILGGILSNLNSALSILDSTVLAGVEAINAPPIDMLETSFTEILTLTKNGTETLASMQPIGSDDATNVVVTTQTVASMVDTLMTDLVSWIPGFEKNGTIKQVLDFLTKFQDESKLFVDTVVRKTPEHARDIARSMLDPVLTSVEEGIKHFKEPKATVMS